MKTKKIVLASLGLMSAFGSEVYAESNNNFKVDLDFRTFYMDRDFNAGPPDTIAGGQAFKVDVISPMWNDFIGVHVGAVHVVALEDKKTINTSGVLAEGGEGYSTLETAYLKLKPSDNANIRLGRMQIKTHLLNDGRSRISTNSSQAIWGDYKYDSGKVYAFYSDRASRNNRESFTRYEANGEEYGIASIGAKHNFDNGLSGELQYAVADDYLRQSFVNLKYKTSLADNKLMLDLKHLRGEDAGDLFGRDYNSNLTTLTARLATGNLAYMLSYQTVGGDDRYSQNWGGQDNTQFWTSGAIQFLDFNAKDEKTLQARIDYDVPSVPGLHLMARHSQSWDVDYSGGDNGKRNETNFDVKYSVQSGAAKGLNLRLRVADVDSDAGIAPFTDVTDVRLIMDYKYSVL